MKQLLYLTVIIALFSACKSKNGVRKNDQSLTSKDSSTAHDSLPMVKNDSLYRLHISFYSTGGGIDSDAHQKFTDWLQTRAVNMEQHYWGREGEVDYCLKLSELSTTEQQDFVKKARELLSSSQLVHINENVVCPHKK